MAVAVLFNLVDFHKVLALCAPHAALLKLCVAPHDHEQADGGADGKLQREHAARALRRQLGRLVEDQHAGQDDEAVDQVAEALLRKREHDLLPAVRAQRRVGLRALGGARRRERILAADAKAVPGRGKDVEREERVGAGHERRKGEQDRAAEHDARDDAAAPLAADKVGAHAKHEHADDDARDLDVVLHVRELGRALLVRLEARRVQRRLERARQAERKDDVRLAKHAEPRDGPRADPAEPAHERVARPAVWVACECVCLSCCCYGGA